MRKKLTKQFDVHTNSTHLIPLYNPIACLSASFTTKYFVRPPQKIKTIEKKFISFPSLIKNPNKVKKKKHNKNNESYMRQIWHRIPKIMAHLFHFFLFIFFSTPNAFSIYLHSNKQFVYTINREWKQQQNNKIIV